MYHKFMLEIITPEKEFYYDLVEEVILNSLDGLVGVLKGSHPMVIGLKAGLIKFLNNGKWIEAETSEGFAEIKPDKVNVLLQTVGDFKNNNSL